MKLRVLNASEVHLLDRPDAFAEINHLGEWDGAAYVAKWKELIESGRGYVMVAEQAGVPIGFMGWTISENPMIGKLVATEAFWFVEPAMRRRGVGWMLLDALESWCDHEKMSLVMPSPATADGERLAETYQSRGYRELETLWGRSAN